MNTEQNKKTTTKNDDNVEQLYKVVIIVRNGHVCVCVVCVGSAVSLNVRFDGFINYVNL